MTDTKKIQQMKDSIKLVIGEKEYLTFMGKLAGSIDTISSLAQEYGLTTGVIRHWIETLGYRDGRTRRCLSMHMKRMRRIKERQERNEKLTKFLFSNVKKNP
jgi:hypothetical protein